jgi:hypothetical protein
VPLRRELLTAATGVGSATAAVALKETEGMDAAVTPRVPERDNPELARVRGVTGGGGIAAATAATAAAETLGVAFERNRVARRPLSPPSAKELAAWGSGTAARSVSGWLATGVGRMEERGDDGTKGEKGVAIFGASR